MLVKAFWPAAYVTYYAIPLDVCQRGRSLTEQVARGLVPGRQRSPGNGDHEGVKRMYLRATRLLASLVIPALVLLAVFSYSVLNAWQGPDIAGPSAPVLVLAAAAFSFQFVGALQNMFLSAMGRTFSMAKWNLAQGAATVLLDLLLIPRRPWTGPCHGIVGAAAALLLAGAGTILPFICYVSAGGASISRPPADDLRAAPLALAGLLHTGASLGGALAWVPGGGLRVSGTDGPVLLGRGGAASHPAGGYEAGLGYGAQRESRSMTASHVSTQTLQVHEKGAAAPDVSWRRAGMSGKLPASGGPTGCAGCGMNGHGPVEDM